MPPSELLPVQIKVDGHALSPLGSVSGIKYSDIWRPDKKGFSGPFMFECRWNGESNATPSFMQRGARIEATVGGAIVWGGMLLEVTHDNPRTIHAIGWGDQCSKFLAIKAMPSVGPGFYAPTWDAQVAFDEAVLRGLQMQSYGTLGAIAEPADGKDPLMFGVLLDRVAAAQGDVWHVDSQGELTMRPAGDLDTPVWGIVPDTAVVGVADDDYVSSLFGYLTYDLDGTGAGTATKDVAIAVGSDAEQRWGTVEEWIDYRKRGVQSNTAAVSADLTERLKLAGGRMSYSNPVKVSPSQLRRLGMGAASIHGPRGGDWVRVFGSIDSAGNLQIGGSVDIQLGRVDVDVDADEVTLSPTGLASRDLGSILADYEPPDGSVTEA